MSNRVAAKVSTKEGMHVRTLQENILASVTELTRIVGRQQYLPITNHILLEAVDGRLRLRATDLETALTDYIGAQFDKEDEGAIAVPARALRDTIRSFPKEALDIVVTGRTVTISSGSRKAVLIGMDADDFPPIPHVEGEKVGIDPTTLRDGINQTVYAAATDDSRPTLTGLHFLVEGDGVTGTLALAAADGFRLAVHRSDVQTNAERIERIIPARAMGELARLLKQEEYPIELTISETQVHVALHRRELVAQLIRGTFPNYTQLVPQSSKSRVTVIRTELLEQVRAAKVYVRDGSGIVRLQANAGSLHVTARAEEQGDYAADIAAALEGEPCKIAVNAPYLESVLAALPDDAVVLRINSPSEPIRIDPVGRDDFAYVVMPMFVDWKD
jgi:DNA polymerase-3 subunit beta